MHGAGAYAVLKFTYKGRGVVDRIAWGFRNSAIGILAMGYSTTIATLTPHTKTQSMFLMNSSLREQEYKISNHE
jgi:hypothetical protein